MDAKHVDDAVLKDGLRSTRMAFMTVMANMMPSSGAGRASERAGTPPQPPVGERLRPCRKAFRRQRLRRG